MSEINLLPWRLIQRRKQGQQFLIISICACVVAGLMLLLYDLSLLRTIRYQRLRNQCLQQEISQYAHVIVKVKNLQLLRLALIAKLQEFARIRQASAAVITFLHELKRLVPTGLALSRIETRHEIIDLNGCSQQSYNITQFLHNLNTYHGVFLAHLPEISHSNVTALWSQQFKLRAVIKS